MAPSRTYLPVPAQWRLLLAARRFTPAAVRVGYALEAAHVGSEVLEPLLANGWIEGRLNGEAIDPDAVLYWKDNDAVQIWLTTGAQDWLQNSAFNLALFTVWAAAGNQRMGTYLYSAARDGNLDIAVFCDLAEAGIMTLLGGDGETLNASQLRRTRIDPAQRRRVALTSVGADIAKT